MATETLVSPGFTCPVCAHVNRIEDDVAEGWCEKCENFTGEPQYQIVPPRTWVTLGRSDTIRIRTDSDRPIRVAVRYEWGRPDAY